MKRILALILTILLSLSMIPAVIVSAENMPTVIVSNAEAKVGDTVKITVSVQNNPGIMSMQLKVGYDSNALKFEGAKESDFKNLTYGPPTKNPFITTWMDPLNTENNTTDGVFVTLEFTVLDTAPNGKSEIIVTYDVDEIFDTKFDNVAFDVQNGYVNINNPNSNEQQNTSSQPDSSSEPTDLSQPTDSQVTSDITSLPEDTSKPSVNSSTQEQNTVTDGATDPDINKDSANEDNTKNNKDDNNDWIIWVVVAAVIALGGSFVAFILISKKK